MNTYTDEPKPVVAVVTDRADAPAHEKTTIETPRGHANLIIVVMSPIAQILVRTLRTFLQAFVGFLGGAVLLRGAMGNLGVEIQPNDLLDACRVAAGLALLPTLMAFIQNMLELLARLDAKFPKARA